MVSLSHVSSRRNPRSYWDGPSSHVYFLLIVEQRDLLLALTAWMWMLRVFPCVAQTVTRHWIGFVFATTRRQLERAKIIPLKMAMRGLVLTYGKHENACRKDLYMGPWGQLLELSIFAQAIQVYKNKISQEKMKHRPQRR